MKSLSVKTKVGWITAVEFKGKIIRVKFEKSRKNSKSKSLNKFKKNLTKFFKNKNNLIEFNYSVKGNKIQKSTRRVKVIWQSKNSTDRNHI